MSYQSLSKKARASILYQAKKQMYKNTVEFREDSRPVGLIDCCYQQLNEELFDGCLPEDLTVVYNGRLRRTLGKAYYRYESGGVMMPTKIELRRGHKWTPRFLRKVLTHEMCHIWAYQEHNEDGHGKHFWKKMTELGYPKTHDWEDSKPWERDIYC